MPFPDFTPTVPELLHTAATRFGAHPYLVVEGERLSYVDADRRSAALAQGMLAEGIGKGAAVGLLMPNSVDFAIAAFAVTRMGALFVPINTFSQTRRARMDDRATPISPTSSRTRASSPTTTSNGSKPRSPGSLRNRPSGRCSCPTRRSCAPSTCGARRTAPGHVATKPRWSPPASAPASTTSSSPRVEECVVPADPAVIVYSSGSTADPKGAIHSQGALVRHSCNVLVGYPMGPDDVMFSSMPFFWIGGLVTALLQVHARGRHLVTQSSFEPAAALDLIEQERADDRHRLATAGQDPGRAPDLHPPPASVRWCARAWLISSPPLRLPRRSTRHRSA